MPKFKVTENYSQNIYYEKQFIVEAESIEHVESEDYELIEELHDIQVGSEYNGLDDQEIEEI